MDMVELMAPIGPPVVSPIGHRQASQVPGTKSSGVAVPSIAEYQIPANRNKNCLRQNRSDLFHKQMVLPANFHCHVRYSAIGFYSAML